jgi:hypothetical protein
VADLYEGEIGFHRAKWSFCRLASRSTSMFPISLCSEESLNAWWMLGPTVPSLVFVAPVSAALMRTSPEPFKGERTC